MEAGAKWEATFAELKSVQRELMELQRRGESYDLIFTARQYRDALQVRLDSLSPKYVASFGGTPAPLEPAVRLLREALEDTEGDVEQLRRQAAACGEEAEAKEALVHALRALLAVAAGPATT